MTNCLFAALQAAPPIILALSVRIENPFVGQAPTSYGSARDVIKALISPILFLLTENEIIIGVLALLILVLCRLTDRLKLVPEIFQIFVIVGVISLCVPSRLLGTFGGLRRV